MIGRPDTPAGPFRRTEWLVFAATLLAFAWFHQGGGWNQNARFALVRAIVEERRLPIDSFLVYTGAQGGTRTKLARSPVRDGELTVRGERVALWWRDVEGRPVPLTGAVTGRLASVDPGGGSITVQPTGGPPFRIEVDKGATVSRDGSAASPSDLAPEALVRVDLGPNDGRRPRAVHLATGPGVVETVQRWTEPGSLAVTGDFAYHSGHFHPNKAPGGPFLAVPGYALVHAVGRAMGEDPDDWWILTRNAWLTTILGVGLFAAVGCVVFFRLALALSGGRAVPSLLATLTFAFGTMYLPYATTLYEHDVIAALLLLAFYLLFRSRAAGDGLHAPRTDAGARRDQVLAGAAAGMAAVTNYTMAAVVLLLLAYAALASGRRRAWLWYGLGVLGPFLLLCAYDVACFGTPFTTNYQHQDPAFTSGPRAFLGVFLAPRWDVLWMVLVSPFRGLFLGAPALLLGAYGMVLWFCSGRMRAEVWLSLGVLAFFLAFIVTFNGWHGGWAVGPRYLLPGVPFLALPAVLAFSRARAVSTVVAVASVALNLLVTAVDPQAPLGNMPLATVATRPLWSHDPITEWEWPIFVEGQPSLRTGPGTPGGGGGVDRRALAAFAGPVSANPMGVYEGWMFRVFPPGSRPARMNSFNAGEFLFPGSRWSLFPLILAEAVLLGWALWTLLRGRRGALGELPPP